MMKITTLLTSLCSIALLAAVTVAVEPAGRRPIQHLRAVDADGEEVGEYLVVHDNDSTPPAILGLVRTKDNYRAQLRFTLDREKGVATQRFLDHQSGWWVERRHDFGMRTLGGPEDFYDGIEWVAAVRDRHERESPTATYTLTTSDGAHVEWTKAAGASDQEAEKAWKDALATFASVLAETDPPASALAELEFVSALLQSAEGDAISTFRHLVHEAVSAARAAIPSMAASRELQVDVNREQPGAVAGLMSILDESPQEAGCGQRP